MAMPTVDVAGAMCLHAGARRMAPTAMGALPSV